MKKYFKNLKQDKLVLRLFILSFLIIGLSSSIIFSESDFEIYHDYEFPETKTTLSFNGTGNHG